MLHIPIVVCKTCGKLYYEKTLEPVGFGTCSEMVGEIVCPRCTEEEIILNVLNEDVSSYVHLMEHDQKRLAHTIALRLEANDKLVLELKRKATSDETLAKLSLIQEIGSLHDELKKIPWYRFAARNIVKWKILELDSKLRYGRHFKTNV